MGFIPPQNEYTEIKMEATFRDYTDFSVKH